MVRDHTQIEQHAYGDEKQAQQNIPERLDVLLDLVPVFGLRDKHSRKKGTQRERQTSQIGQPRKPQGDQQDIEHEQLTRSAQGDGVKPGAHDALPKKQQHAEHDCCLQRSPKQMLREFLGGL